jgi:hypothetical protein
MRQQPTPTRGLPGQTYFPTQRALDEIRSRIGSAASRDAVIELETNVFQERPWFTSHYRRKYSEVL